VKKIILFFYFLSLCLYLQAQEKQVFTETFIDNRNQWPIISKKGLVTSLVPGQYYEINNRSKKDFSAVIPLPFDSSGDFRIKMAVKDMHFSDKDSWNEHSYFNFVIGATDENSGYAINISDKALVISELTADGKRNQLYYGDVKWTPSHDYLDLRIEHNRWKFYTESGLDAANIPAYPLKGNKFGVLVWTDCHYGLTAFTVEQPKKEIIKTNFPLALFMFVYPKLLCSASHLFKDDVGAQYGTPADSTWYCKTNVPGFASNTLLVIEKDNIELLTNRSFKTKDEAFAYYKEALGGIKLTKDTCLEMGENTDELSKWDKTDEGYFKTHFIQFNNWRTGFRDDHAKKVEGNVLLGLSENSGKSEYMVEFHMMLRLTGKVFDDE
jgi:hypothetical protein